MSFLRDALDYMVRGWCVLPVRFAGTQKKVSLRTWKRWQRERPSEAKLREWFSRPRLDGLAVVCGTVSGGLCVRDFDDMEAYRQWAAAHPDLAATLPTVETGRPGRHVYCRVAPEYCIFEDLDDGEYRAASSHYVLLPPSNHPEGPAYRWLVPLPDGPLPLLDPVAAGLLPADLTPLQSSCDGADDAGVVHKENPKKTQRNTGLPNDTESNGGGGWVSDENARDANRIDFDKLTDADLDAIARAIRGSQPSEEGQRHRMLFKLARTLKGLPALASAPVGDMRPVVQQWHKLALPAIGTKDFDESWADFVVAWNRVKYPRGAVVNAILQRAKVAPPAPGAERYETAALRLLVNLCHELQAHWGNQPFPLDARTAGELLGVGTMTAWRYLKTLEADDVLALVEVGTRGGKGTARRASTYRYVGGRDDQQATAARMNGALKRLTDALSGKARPPRVNKSARMAEIRRQLGVDNDG